MATAAAEEGEKGLGCLAPVAPPSTTLSGKHKANPQAPSLQALESGPRNPSRSKHQQCQLNLGL